MGEIDDMKATICDRCLQPFEPIKRGERKYQVRTVGTEVVRKQMSRGIEVDLCPVCYEEFIQWFTRYEKNQMKNSSKAFDLTGIQSARPGAFFHGEEWYLCPHCGYSVEAHNCIYEHDGIKKVEGVEDVYICPQCNNMFRLPD